MNELFMRSPRTITSDLTFSRPSALDGRRINHLVEDSPPLDRNSLYCNILQCDQFADTTVIAQNNGDLAGFVTGFLLPAQTTTLFIWQIAVAKPYRGTGLATKLLNELLLRPACRLATHIETHIGPENEDSWRLFKKLAERLYAPVSRTEGYGCDTHFGNGHGGEQLIRIGPIATPDHALYPPKEAKA